MSKRRRHSRAARTGQGGYSGKASAGRIPPPGPYATQPYNRLVWPAPAGISTRAPLVYDAWSAVKIPGVARALAIYTGSLKQAPLDDVRGIEPLPRPRLLEQPDPREARSWFVQLQVEDYFLHGNAVCYITARDANNWPAAVVWLPADWLTIACPPRRYDQPTYLIDGIEINRDNIVHVKRGADRWCPARGVSIVEQHLATLDRAAMEEQYERDALNNGSVPSVAVITPNPRLGEEEAAAAKIEWMAKYGGPNREPAILPAGTQVIPLGFSPEDSQMIAARQMTLLDIANVFNMDGYWLGAPAGSMTYRSPGSMYTNLLRVSLEPVLADFEDVWSLAWLPRGRRVRFDRNVLTRDDLATTIDMMTTATGAVPPLLSTAEARAHMGLSPTPVMPDTPPPAPEPEPELEPEPPQQQEEEE